MGGLDFNTIYNILLNIIQVFCQFGIMVQLFGMNFRVIPTIVSSVIVGMLYVDNQMMMYVIYYGTTFVYFHFVAQMPKLRSVFALTTAHFVSIFIQNLAWIALAVAMMFGDNVDMIIFGIKCVVTLVWMLLLALVQHRDWKPLLNYQKNQVTLPLIYNLLFVVLFTMNNRMKTTLLAREGNVLDQMLPIMGMMALQVFATYNFLNIERYATEVERLEYHKLYTEALESSYEKLRIFKHGHRGMIHSIRAMLYSKDYPALEQYLEGMKEELQPINNIDITATTLKDTDILSGIIYKAMIDAEANNVNFSVNISAKNLQVSTITTVELTRVVDNFLNNAIEAAKESEDRFVSLDVSNYQQLMLRIVIKNTYAGHVNLEKISGKGYTTKAEHTGLGLYEAKSLIERYQKKGKNVSLKTYIAESKYFVQELQV